MFGHSAAVLLALAASTASDSDVTSFCHDHLAVGQKFEIVTVGSTLRGELIDRATGECHVAFSADGRQFTAPRTVYLLGATLGQQDRHMLVVMHQIKVGQKIELGVDDLEQSHRQVTGEVTGIRLLR